MIRQLKQDIATGNKVIMLTARSDFNDRDVFLDTFRQYGIDMDRVHVYRAGNLNIKAATEEKKKIILKHLLGKEHYDKIIMYDDSVPNLNAFLSLKQDYPWSKFYAWHVDPSGQADEYHRTDIRVTEVSADRLQQYLNRAEQQVDRRQERMALARERLNKGYEIYHADRPAGITQIVDRFEANTPAEAQRYYEKFIARYESDRDFDLRLRRATGIMEDAFRGIDISMERDDDEIMVRASAGGKQLGSVLFVEYDGYLMPQDLEVDERFRGQGIAQAMYDYVKSRGYRIRRSGQQTDAGAGFWSKHRPGKNIWEDTEEYLYHATYRPLLKSIQAQGLGNTTQSQWTDSQPGVVYLARDPEVARSYAETAESVPEDWLDQIVVLVIDARQLDPKKLHTDRNVMDDDSTLEYHGVIRDFQLTENFADGRVQGKSRPGRVKRSGASCNGSVTDLRRRAKNASGEKAKMYHWCANMKSGRKK
jgi:GNAT superfamily N-acetyltransferase